MGADETPKTLYSIFEIHYYQNPSELDNNFVRLKQNGAR
jgi:hypothetical protein